MKLQTRLFFAFALSVALPLAFTAVMTRRSIRAEFDDYYEARLEQTDQAVRLVYADLVRDEQTRLANLCRGDPQLEISLVKLASRNPVPDLLPRLDSWVKAQARTLNFDTLDILDREGVVLASAHYPGRRGEPAPGLAALVVAAEGRALIAPITRAVGDGAEQESLALLTSCRALGAGEELALLAGRVVDESLAARISSRLGLGDVSVFVLDHQREPIGVSDQVWDEASRLRRVYVPLVNPDETTPAYLTIAVDDSREERAVQKLDWSNLGMIVGALLVSWLIGMVVARNIGRPLARLADQARRVAAGELGGTVDVTAPGEVRDLVEAFNVMSVDLKESRNRLVQAERIAAWRDIARRIAHEIKNPLFPIQTSIETIRKAYAKKHPDFDEIFEEATVTILEEVERLKRIVTEFSRFARLPKPAPEAVDLGELFNTVIALYAGQDVAVEARVEPGAGPINADREQLTQVLHNLVQNAIDAVKQQAPAEPRVELSAEPRPAGVAIVVRDNGTGMDAETMARIFEPYYTTKEGRGTGLGLAIVHRIVTDHGGTIAVDSTQGHGATFTIVLTREGPPPFPPTLPPGPARPMG
jgi:signal transduction histidine kinase